MRPVPALISVSTEEGILIELRVGGHPVTIGRAFDNLLRSYDRNVSRHHAEVHRLPDGSYEVEDRGSAYGTFLNGRPVTRQVLRDGDMMRVGDLLLRFTMVPGIEIDEPDLASLRAEVQTARDRIVHLVEQTDDLRREVRLSQDEEDRAGRERDDAVRELGVARRSLETSEERARALESRLAELQAEVTRLRATPPAPVASEDAQVLGRQLREARSTIDQLKAQMAAMAERDAHALAMKKEIDRLTEQVRLRELREATLTESVRPAMTRIADLSGEVERQRIQIAALEVELAEARKR